MPLDSRSVDQLLAVVALELDVLPVRPMEALLRRGDEALPRLLEHMRSGGWKRIENPQWFTILLGLLAPGRDEAAAAAVLFEVLERAVDMDAEEEEWLAVAAAEALARLGEAAIPTVRAGLSHEREAVRVYLCAVLGWIGSAEAVRILLELAESDLSVADAVAQALTDAVCVEAVPTLYRLLGRCPGHHRIEVEEAIRELGHDVPVKVPLDDDWRLRYRPDTWFESFDPGWAGIAAMTREIDAEHLAKRPAPPLRSLEEILADPPEEPVDRDRGPCVVCGDPGRTRLGLTTCSREHEGQMAWIQRRLLEEWANEGETDVFQVLGDAEWDLRTLRRWIMPAIYEAADSDPDDAPWLPGLEPSDDRGGTPEVSAEVLEDSETWEAELAIVHGTCRWFLERGEEELASALSRLLQAAEAGGTARRLSPAEAGRATSSVGRNDPCPCGSGRKHKKCCGRPGASPGGGGGSPVEPFGAPAPGGGTGPGGSSPFGGSEGASPFLSLVDPQGNPVVISRAHYHLVDASALRLALQADERFEATDDPGEPDDASAPGDPSEPDDPSADGTPIGSGTPPDGFVWGEPMSGPIASVAEGARRILGMVVLEGDRLTLECMSRERLAAGRKILEELAGSAIEHRADTAQDPWQATRDPARPRRRPGGEKDEIPLEVRRDLIQRLLDAQYRTWPDERLPALHGLTPREAADLVVGRRRLDALIGSFEAAERRRMAEDGFAYDFTWLRKELDLA